VEGPRDRQSGDLNPARFEVAAQGFDGLAGPRDHDVQGRVDRGDGGPVGLGIGLEGLTDPGLRSPDPGHGSRRQALHQAAPGGDQIQALLPGQDPGDAGRHVFAHAVAQHGGGHKAPMTPQLPQGPFEGEQGRLGVEGLVQVVAGGVAQHLEQGSGQVGVHPLGAALQGGSKDRLRAQESLAHPGVLRALPREEQCHARGVSGRSASQAGRCRAVGRPCLQGVGRRLGLGADQAQTPGQVGAPASRRVADVAQVRASTQGLGEVSGLAPQGLRSPGR